jgi:hypothetical protein
LGDQVGLDCFWKFMGFHYEMLSICLI